CIGSFGLSGCWSFGCCGTRRFLVDCRFSITWVVEIFTTAGSTRFTIDANEFDDGIASGIASGVAPLPAKATDFMAEVRPDTIVPIRIPSTSVSATNNPAIIFSRRAQLTILLTGSSISTYSCILSAAASLGFQGLPYKL